MSREIKGTELALHSSRSSAWVVINDAVYDITSLLGEHPGGSGVLLQEAGGNGTRTFTDQNHSTAAVQRLEAFKIGCLPKGTPQLTMDDVMRNNFIVMRGLVYDVSAFLVEHPGGAEILRDNLGTDATAAFDAVGHSEGAKARLSTYFVGVLKSGEVAANAAPAPTTAPKVVLSGPANSPVPMDAKTTSLTYLTSLAWLLLAIVVYYVLCT